MKLLTLDIENFKKIREFSFAPHGADADIYGDNATGKTSIADAYFWLLFGKDSDGKSDFNVLPMDSDGKIVPGLEASVAGTFSGDDGKEFKLCRAYHQVFTRKNGEAERKFKGNTTEFFIDDVPKPQKDYQAFISKICGETTFQLLTDPDMFPGKMKWDERRDMLIRLYAPDIDDREIINAHKELQPLGGYIGYRSVDEYVEVTKAQRRKINDQLKEIPGRIDEAEKAKPADLPAAGDGLEIVRLARGKMKLEADLNRLRSGESVSALQKKIAETQAKIAKASAEYTRRASAGNSALEASASRIRAQISESEKNRNYLEFSISSKEATTQHLAAEMDRLRQQCRETAVMEFDPSNNICPTCGQEYPAEKREQIQADFNLNKAEKLKRLESDGKQRKAEKEALEKEIGEDKVKLQREEQDLSELRTQLDNLMHQFVSPAPFEETDRFVDLNKTLEAAQNELKVVQTAADKRVSALQEQLSDITSQLDTVRKRALNKEAADRQDQRIEELKKKDRDLSFQLAKFDDGLTLAEKFTQQKAKDIEDKVNGAFRIVRWKLFDTQVNGGVKPCCEATVEGIPYSKGLNSAARLNSGLDIIDALSEKVGRSVPLWIDNAESVTKYLPVNAQVFRLHVASEEQELKVVVQK
ncbi:MAG: AAA family ATPase [Oscillospiraceae bacterium]|jgi:DNA repair exonuclease SbcCD ATPase subunit|nr:AAA family ATPase [Oscillospiraceae bacterium]MCI2034795.1 AAA family ATPase [Oscillospiraceae bacterium]